VSCFAVLTKEPKGRRPQIFQNVVYRRLDRSMALIALLVLLISSTCQAFGVPSASRCRAPAAATTFAGSSIVMKEQKDVLELEGIVLEAMPNANFRVQLDDTEQVRTLL